MSEQAQPETNERMAIQTLAGALGGSMQKMAVTAEVQQIAILGIGAILACLPDTAKIPQEHLGAALALLSQGRSKEFTQKLATFMANTVAASRQVPELAAQLQAKVATKN